jgi:hypothetical protein
MQPSRPSGVPIAGDQGRGADAASFAEPGHGLAELPGLAEIGHEHPVSHAGTRARYVRLAPFSFLILIHRFVTLDL